MAPDEPSSEPLGLAVVSASSEEPGYQAKSMLKGDPLSAGWRSAAGCAYPQELVLAIDTDVAQVHTIQFVSHEYLVPSVVELYTSLYRTGQEWVRLGHVKMGTAAGTARGRERKTVKIKVRAVLLRLVLSQPIAHERNGGGQVGLASIVVYGIPQGKQRPGSALAGNDSSGIPDAVSRKAPRMSQLMTRGEQLKTEISIAKAKAVEAEDFLEAERLKSAFERLAEILRAYEQLEVRKLTAISKEDYRAAHEISTNIQEIKNLTELPFNELVCVLNGEEVRPRSAAPVQPPVAATATPVSAAAAAAAAAARPSPVLRPEDLQGQAQDKGQGQGAAADDPTRYDYLMRPKGESPVGPTGERAIRPMNQQQLDELFRLDEDARTQREQALASNVRRRKQLMKKSASRASGLDTDALSTTTASTTRSQVSKSVSGPQAFVFDEAIDVLAEKWERHEAPPPDIAGGVLRGPMAQNLRAAGFTDIFLRLACSKAVHHVQDCLAFMSRALAADPARFWLPSASMISLISESTNMSLLGHASHLLYETYVACLKTRTGLAPAQASAPVSASVSASASNAGAGAGPGAGSIPDVSFALKYPNVTAKVAAQKDNAIVCAVLTASKGEDYLQRRMGGNAAAFASDVMTLLAPIIAKVHESQRRAKLNALNMLATTGSFCCFPARAFVTTLIAPRFIERSAGLAPAEANLQNARLQHAVESRAWACASLVEALPLLVREDTLQPIGDLCSWVLPTATKTEQKRPLMELLALVYASDAGGGRARAFAVDAANASCKSQPMLKAVARSMEAVDRALGLPQPRVLYTAASDTDVGKIVLRTLAAAGPASADGVGVGAGAGKAAPASAGANDDEFPPGMCQFCLWEADSRSAGQPGGPPAGQSVDVQMWTHLMKDCPCCCSCPCCEMIVEIPCLPDHIMMDCARIHDLGYTFMQCPKCRILLTADAYDGHVAECAHTLGETEAVCPLCGVVLHDGEEALMHYSEGEGCKGNPRTTVDLKSIVAQKVDK